MSFSYTPRPCSTAGGAPDRRDTSANAGVRTRVSAVRGRRCDLSKSTLPNGVRLKSGGAIWRAGERPAIGRWRKGRRQFGGKSRRIECPCWKTSRVSRWKMGSPEHRRKLNPIRIATPCPGETPVPTNCDECAHAGSSPARPTMTAYL